MSTCRGDYQVAVEQAQNPLSNEKDQAPQSEEEVVGAPPAPHAVAEHVIENSAPVPEPIRIENEPADASAPEILPFLPPSFFARDENPIADQIGHAQEDYNDSDEENEELGTEGIGLIIDVPDVPATAEEGENGIIEEDNLPPEPPAPAPETESALPLPGGEPTFEDVDNPGKWPPECFHPKFGKKMANGH